MHYGRTAIYYTEPLDRVSEARKNDGYRIGDARPKRITDETERAWLWRRRSDLGNNEIKIAIDAAMMSQSRRQSGYSASKTQKSARNALWRSIISRISMPPFGQSTRSGKLVPWGVPRQMRPDSALTRGVSDVRIGREGEVSRPVPLQDREPAGPPATNSRPARRNSHDGEGVNADRAGESLTNLYFVL